MTRTAKTYGGALYDLAAEEGRAELILQEMLRADNFHIFWDGSIYTCGLNAADFALMIIGLTVLLLVLWPFCPYCRASLMDRQVKNLPAMQETQV